MIKRIQVPETATIAVRVKAPDGSVQLQTAEVPFADFVCDTLLEAKRWQASTKALRLSIEIEDRFRDAKPMQLIDVSEDAHRGLCESLDPSGMLSRGVAAQLMRAGYWEAIEDALEAEPQEGS